MDTLPQDIIDHIVSYLLAEKFKPRKPYTYLHPRLPRAHLATISRRLQTAVERWAFRDIRINSEELGEFCRLLTPARRTFLAGLEFIPILPSYGATASARAEAPSERAANDERYTRAVQSLLETLKAWEEEDPLTVRYRLKLSINHPQSPSDRAWPGIFPPWKAVLPKGNCIYEGRHLHSYINILRLESLPEVHRVKNLVMQRPDDKHIHRNVCPKVPMMLASKMPNIESVDFSMDDSEERFLDLRRSQRQEAADTLRDLSLPELKSARLDFWHRRYRNEVTVPPLLHGEDGPDPLCSAICDFSMNLVNLELAGIFDASLLRPLSKVPWPNLQTLHIQLEPVTPSGEWYFLDSQPQAQHPEDRPSSGYTHTNLHLEGFSFRREAAFASQRPIDAFRGRVNDKILAPLVEAYADALSVMPKLVAATLTCDLDIDDEMMSEPPSLKIAYFAPGAVSDTGLVDPIGNARQLVTSLLGWVPSVDLMAKLRGIQDAYRIEPMRQNDTRDSLEGLLGALHI